MRWTVAALPGDGIGPEVTRVAMDLLAAAAGQAGAGLVIELGEIGWTAVRSSGSPLPQETVERCLAADAVFLGAVGDPAADGAPEHQRPERGLLGLRAALGCWANLRPIRVPDALIDCSALRPERVRGTDLLILRELGGGLYYGEPREEGPDMAVNTLRYTRAEVERIADLAFDLAAKRRGRVTSVEKANVLEVSRLWRRVTTEAHARRAAEPGVPPVELDHMLADRVTMELILNPSRFDVILTGNLFGDLLSDEAGAVAGSLGLLGSASLGGTTDLYEPVHGSAPDIAGKGVANPVGAFTSVAMMLRYTFDVPELADRVDEAIEQVLTHGIRTGDLPSVDGRDPVGTHAFSDAIAEAFSAGGAG